MPGKTPSKANAGVEPFERFRIGVGGPEEAEAVVDRLARKGVDFVKLRSVSSVETYRALTASARNKRTANRRNSLTSQVKEFVAEKYPGVSILCFGWIVRKGVARFLLRQQRRLSEKNSGQEKNVGDGFGIHKE